MLLNREQKVRQGGLLNKIRLIKDRLVMRFRNYCVKDVALSSPEE